MAAIRRSLAVLALAIAHALPIPAARAEAPCPAETGCRVAGGHYRIMMPDGAKGRPGAIVFFHGWQGSAEETISDLRLLAAARELGVALVAPDGEGRTWSYPNAPGRHRDEFAFTEAVVADAVARFGLDPSRLMASGFSQGGSMVWYLACTMPGRFAAFAPLSGAFWVPLPETCASPRPPLVHVHGLADRTVPMEGRALRSGHRQGDVRQSLARLAPGCTAAWRPAGTDQGLSCESAAGCPGTARLDLCLHEGDHDYRGEWIVRAWRLTIGRDMSAAPRP